MNVYKYVNRGDSALSIGAINIPPKGSYTSYTVVDALDRLDGVLVDKYLNQVSRSDPKEFNYYRPVISNAKGDGIQLNGDNPKFGWHDALSFITIDLGAASNKPTFSTFIGTVKKYQFVVGDESYHNYHIPHDYLPGSDLYIHVHWATNATNVLNGTTTWNFEATYSKGYAQGTFNTPVNVQVVGVATETSPFTHYISEVLLSGVETPGLLDTNLIEADGILLVRTSLINHTLDTNPFMLFCDMHYQSTGIPTINRNHPFW